ncbi:MAG TPA: twin-arginine translocase TatA/TatE family subunit, partial [Pyrinomonadaceae bacterium]|nr:twin-arginine translocase TatA/TatE family subunit [Pyrinomonadaceae bacterium]
LAGPDLLIILSIVLILFGAKKLPDLARSMGQSMNEFRKAREDIDRDLKEAVAQPSQPRSSQGQQCGAHSRAPRDHGIQSEAEKPFGPPSYRTDFTRGTANEVYDIHQRNNKYEQV